MPTGKGAFGPVIVVPATSDPDHQVEAPTLTTSRVASDFAAQAVAYIGRS